VAAAVDLVLSLTSVPLTLNLWPLKLPSMSRMLLVSSPKAMIRVGWKSVTGSLPPQAARSSIAASTPPVAARRACFAISLIRIGLQESGFRSSPRRG
jgi:hypothetical protein